MCIPVMYLLALRLTKDSRYAMLAGLLQITEFMHYSLSRISTIDIIVAFFVLCMFYGCIAFVSEEKNRYLVISGAAFAFGIATKWTAAYAAAGLALILFIWMIGKIRKKSKASDIVKFVLICVGSFIVFPAIVYVLSYIPFVKVYPNKNLIEHAISNSIHMFEYHSNVTAEHPYSSPWYSWLIDWHPLTDFRLITDGYKSVIATFVNPFVCFTGLLSVIHHGYLAIRKKDNVSAVLLVFYISMLLPWVFITRTVFIYQYFVCTKVLILMICRSIQCIGFKREESVIRFSAAVSGTLFVLFFPVLSGILFNYDYVDKILTVLPDWWF
jgi:dolichyl-phosphate-mannose--protein O-mannosyl transferase